MGNVRLISILFAIVSFLATTLAAQDAAPIEAKPVGAQARPAGPQSVDDSSQPSPRPAVDQGKMIKATFLLAAVGGIAILGIATIAATMIWARHLRRLARDLGPAQTTVGDDFWFLKPPKPISADSDISDSDRPPSSPPETEAPS